jgi:hypothetical protein
MNKGPKLQRERNAIIIRLRAKGKSKSDIAEQFSVSPGRVQQIVAGGEMLEQRRAELRKRYGACPKLERLGDRTPIEVLILCNGSIHGWAVRVCRLRHASKPIKTLGDLRKMTNAELLREPHIGTRMIAELRSFCPARTKSSRGGGEAKH